MLLAIRNRSRQLAAVIIVLLVVPFALMGITQYFTGGQDVPYATVNGVEISQREYDRRYEVKRQTLEQQLSAGFVIGDWDQIIREQVKDQLLREEVLAQLVYDSNFNISPAQLANAIQSDTNFQLDGEFSQEIYLAQLRANGLTPAYFESLMKRQLMIQQLQTGLGATAIAPGFSVGQVANLQFQERDVTFIEVKASAFRDQVQITDEDMQAYFAANKDQYVTQESVDLQYIELDIEDLAKDVVVDEDQLMNFYEDRAAQGNYGVPESRDASHILILVDADASEEEAEEKRQKAADLLARIKNGESLEELAKANSEDPGSAENGGSLGEVIKGQMVPEFEEALFALEEGSISDLVRTDFGFHIIRVDKIHASGQKTFEQVRDQIEEEFRREEALGRYYDLAEQMTDLTYEHSDTLTPAAEALGLEIKEIKHFTRNAGEHPLTQQRTLRNAVFSQDVLEDGNNTEVIELGENHVVVARVLEHFPSEPQSFEEVKPLVEAELEQQKMQALAKENGQALLEQLQENFSIDSLQGSDQHRVTVAGFVARDNIIYDPAFIQKAFSMASGDEKVAVDGIELENGNYGIVALKQVRSKGLDELAESQKLAMNRELIQYNSIKETSAFIEAAKASADITVNEE